MSFKPRKNIEWTESVYNVITGCPGPEDCYQPLDADGHCEGCYAKFRALNRLRGRFGYDEDDPFKLTWHEDKLTLPLSRKKPCIFFVSSMGEWLGAPAEWRRRALRIMLLAHRHIFITLTKQYDRLHLIEEDLKALSFTGDLPSMKIPIPSNIWIGVSISYRKQLYYGLDKLRELDAPLKFASFEPMMQDLGDADLTGLDWIIIGGRTRQGKTPAFIPEGKWVKGLVSLAHECAIPVFLKPNIGPYVKYGWFDKIIEEMPFNRIGGWPK